MKCLYGAFDLNSWLDKLVPVSTIVLIGLVVLVNTYRYLYIVYIVIIAHIVILINNFEAQKLLWDSNININIYEYNGYTI